MLLCVCATAAYEYILAHIKDMQIAIGTVSAG